MRQWTRFAVCIEMGNMPARMTFKLRLTCRWGKTDSKPSVPPVKETAVERGIHHLPTISGRVGSATSAIASTWSVNSG